MADLGGLGSREGTPVHYNLILPSPVPLLLPWLGVLLLLTLRPNRCRQAWWVLAPLVLLAGIVAALQASARSGPNWIFDVFGAVAFGIASLWLLTPYLRRNHRFPTFVLMLAVLASGSELTYLLKQGWGFERAQDLGLIIMVAIYAAACAIALGVAGLLCKRRYSRLRLSLWLIALFLIVSCLTITPFFVAAVISGGAGPGWADLLIAVSAAAAIGFGILLPFLLLSFVNGFHGERLRSLLHVASQPPMVMPAPQPVGAAAGSDVMKP